MRTADILIKPFLRMELSKTKTNAMNTDQITINLIELTIENGKRGSEAKPYIKKVPNDNKLMEKVWCFIDEYTILAGGEKIEEQRKLVIHK